ncbi:MAG: hypothetical protein RLZZ58_1969, partial [Pseudomonadota bacterium]
ELSNLALAHMRVSQIAASLSDNASRISIDVGLPVPQVRESDVNELLAAALKQGESIDLETHGKVILSSLEQNGSSEQWIHWQRCAGDKLFPSSYGNEGTQGGLFDGMGDTGKRIAAPPGAAVMFVEISYDYQPIAYGSWLGPKTMRYTSSFLVRDDRDLAQIYNPSPSAAVATCV